MTASHVVSVKGKEILWYLGNVPSRRIRKQEGCKKIEEKRRVSNSMVRERVSEGGKGKKARWDVGGKGGSLGW